MPLVITDEMLRAAGLSESEAKMEIACRWFDAGTLSFGRAAAFAGVEEIEFERQLQQRNIPRYRYTEEKLETDIESLKKLGRW
jgi:predicted HTH domain antitoxin